MRGTYLPLIAALAGIIGCTGNRQEELSIIGSLQENYAIASNIVYKKTGSANLSLDVWSPADLLGEDPWVIYPDTLRPVLVFFHGGGWVSGDRISRSLYLLPYLEKRWCVVNVDYRLADGSAANIEDCTADCCDAVAWVFENAATFRFDPDRIFLSGESAGGHLALLAGLKFDYPLQIAGIINWFGISDLEELYTYWNDPLFFDRLTEGAEGEIHEILKRNSPVNFLKDHHVPVISIHGDKDSTVPLEQSENLHRILQRFDVKNKLVIIRGKNHGNFSADEFAHAYEEIMVFVEQ